MGECRIIQFELDRFTSIWYCREHEIKLHNATEIGRHVTNPDLINVRIDTDIVVKEAQDIIKEVQKFEDNNNLYKYAYFYNPNTQELHVDIEIDSEDLEESDDLDENDYIADCLEQAFDHFQQYLKTGDQTELEKALEYINEAVEESSENEDPGNT